MRRLILFMTVAFALVAGSAMAESIKGRLGITGQLGFIVPDNSTYTPNMVAFASLPSDKLKSESAFTGGGGLIFGLTDNLAVEAQVLHTPNIDYKDYTGSTVLKVTTTDISLGLQVRNNVSNDLTAYLGGGGDILFNSVRDANDHNGAIDTAYGGHVNVGGDYFLNKYLAINLDLRGTFAPEADIKSGGFTIAKYDPISWSGLFGVRAFFW